MLDTCNLTTEDRWESRGWAGMEIPSDYWTKMLAPLTAITVIIAIIANSSKHRIEHLDLLSTC